MVGTDYNDSLTGEDAQANTLVGGAGNDTIDGGTGAFVDTMLGGLGDDGYTVNHASDIVTEGLSEGTDTVTSTIAYTLGSNVENLTLSAGNIDGTGNSLDNTITGSTGNNVLDGGTGADRMVDGGGGGNDTYFVDSTSDVVTEGASGGADAVHSSVSYSIATIVNVESVILTGSAAINGTGNGGGNTLIGNGGNNVLDGGAGADTLFGGAGDGTFMVDLAGDTITENADEGTDTVQASDRLHAWPPTASSKT